MGRFASDAALAGIAFGCLFLGACSSGNPTHVVANSVPKNISLTPSPNISLEVGKTLGLTATAKNGAGTTLIETFAYQSSDSSVVTVANNGNMCAGTWDSLTVPVVCTPGSTGTAQVAATARGVSSPPVTVFVHQHITDIVISKVPNQPPTLSSICYSKGAPSGPESALYEASAFSGNVDITPSVGPFSWQSVAVTGQTTSAVSLSTPAAGSTQCPAGQHGACLNQQTAAANSPGTSLFFASASGANSQPLQFNTCPVQTISISALDNPSTSFLVNTTVSTTLNATVTDILGMPLTGVPLTWNSTNAADVKVSGASSTVFGSVGSVTASAIGAAAVTASCTPPTCNGGISPSMPIYPTQAISFQVTSSTAPTSPTVYATSTACNPATNTTNQSCTTQVVPITRTSSTADFTAGTPIPLPFAPNSFQFDPLGTNGYLGVDTLAFGTQAAMVLNGTTVTKVSNAAGKVLATSPDGTLAIFSDTADSPNRVFICQSCNSATSQNVATFLLDGAVAAAFSPDSIAGGFKAYIVSGQSCPGSSSKGCLLVFSTVDATQMVPLNGAASDVTFIGNGTLGYIAGGDQFGTAFLPTCSDPTQSIPLPPVSLPGQLIRALPDGQSALASNAPLPPAPTTVQTVTAQISGPPVVGVPGCPTPRGFLSIHNGVQPAADLGAGTFTPTQFFVSPDGLTAYVLGQTVSGATVARLPFLIAFNLTRQTSSDITLAGNAIPLSASISPSGDLLFVGASDGAVHVIDTTTQLDTQQVTFPFPESSLCVGPGNPATQPPVTCNPDLVVVKP
jgi:hypothetical protein